MVEMPRTPVGAAGVGAGTAAGVGATLASGAAGGAAGGVALAPVPVPEAIGVAPPLMAEEVGPVVATAGRRAVARSAAGARNVIAPMAIATAPTIPASASSTAAAGTPRGRRSRQFGQKPEIGVET
jgi:hypothetical protein